jgi:serine/threonine-protein kinase RsbT
VRAVGVSEPIFVKVIGESDIVTARNTGRQIAATLGFSSTDLTLIATAISEVARNIAVYAPPGQIAIKIVERDGHQGVRVEATDHGPGIEDTELALRDGFSTRRSLGIGLPGARRLMDEFMLDSKVGSGTSVTMTKWKRV